jgi:hypothetical protein
MTRLPLAWLVLLFAGIAGPGVAADIGTGFGESLAVLTSARQAGTGGLALEDPWRRGVIFEATTIVMAAGPRWVGLAGQSGLGPSLRLTAEGFLFQTPVIGRTTEHSDGSYGGESGTAQSREWGGRVTGQVDLWETSGWRFAVLGCGSGLVQRLPDRTASGGALEVGGQAQRGLGGNRYLTAWTLVGPLGVGGGRSYAWQGVIGTALQERLAKGLMVSGPAGYSVGLEGEVLREQLIHGGAGALYWFGDPQRVGPTLFLRAGARAMEQSAAQFQVRGGMGVLWRWKSGWGLQFDYAVAPLGDLGLVHYGTLGFRGMN